MRRKWLAPLLGVAVVAGPAFLYFNFIADTRSYNPAFFEARTEILAHCARQLWPHQEHRCVEFVQLMEGCGRRDSCDPETTFEFLVSRDFSVPDLHRSAEAAPPVAASSGAFDDLIPAKGGVSN